MILIIPLIVGSIIITSMLSLQNISGVRAKFYDIFEMSGIQLMNRLSVEVNEIVDELNHLSTYTILANSSTPINEQINMLQRHINFSNSEYLAVSIYDTNGTVIMHTSDKPPEGNVLQEEFFKQSLAGETYFDKNPEEIAFNQTGFHLSVPIYDSNKVIKRIMDVEVSISFIDNVVNNTLFDDGIENSSFHFTGRIVHSDGSVIYSTSQKNDLKNMDGRPDLNFPLPGPSITEYEKRNSQNTILITVPESESARKYQSDGNWTLLLEGNLSPLMSDYNKTVNDFLISSTLILLAAVGVTIVAVKKITSPITHLKNSALDLSKGNFGKEITVEGSNEVKDLSISLEVMRRNIENSKKNLIRKVRERTRDLERANEELRTKEFQVNSINNELIISNRAKEEFLSMISHELKTPITPMKLYIEMMLKGNKSANLNEFQRKALFIMHKNILKLETIIEDIFTVYKLELNNFPINKENTNIVELVENNMSGLSPLMKDKNIQFNSIVNATGSVLCDPVRISQVLFNLVNNAVDHVPEHGGEITIRVDEGVKPSAISPNGNDNKDHKSVIFTVKDNGIGIQPENIEGLFKKFYQIDTGIRRKYGGTGLGLAICKGIIESHGGKIWIDSSYLNGASFKFSLNAF
ncbi:sensor histidine kinase [Candidatus Nitrosocosmicus arcticus]|uniref:sensor histidine kinase n=1 Tax=Candidatus Nitrosocosmicus arcticus TaxID=2035267 RepID=UPI0016450315|nr:sensor histidine kinase [Candidatus Nitrosocosmicus arcticus]